MMHCEDCGRILFAEEVSEHFGPHGVAVCGVCVYEMGQEADAYDGIMDGQPCLISRLVDGIRLARVNGGDIQSP
jgi:hypothetical protein